MSNVILTKPILQTDIPLIYYWMEYSYHLNSVSHLPIGGLVVYRIGVKDGLCGNNISLKKKECREKRRDKSERESNITIARYDRHH